MVANKASAITCHNLRPHRFFSVTGSGVVEVSLGSNVFTFGVGIKTSLLFCAKHDTNWKTEAIKREHIVIFCPSISWGNSCQYFDLKWIGKERQRNIANKQANKRPKRKKIQGSARV